MASARDAGGALEDRRCLFTPAADTRDHFGRFIGGEIAKWGQAAKNAAHRSPNEPEERFHDR